MSDKTKMPIIRQVLGIFTSQTEAMKLVSEDDIKTKILPVVFEYGYTNINCCTNKETGINDIITISKENGDKESEIVINCKILNVNEVIGEEVRVVLGGLTISIGRESLSIERYKDIQSDEYSYRCTETFEYVTDRNYLKRTLFTMSEDGKFMYVLSMVEDAEYSAMMNAKLSGTLPDAIYVILPIVEVYMYKPDVDNSLASHISTGNYSPMKRTLSLFEYDTETIEAITYILSDMHIFDIDTEEMISLISNYVNMEHCNYNNVHCLSDIKYDEKGNINSGVFIGMANGNNTTVAIAYDTTKGATTMLPLDKKNEVINKITKMIEENWRWEELDKQAFLQEMCNLIFGDKVIQINDRNEYPAALELFTNMILMKLEKDNPSENKFKTKFLINTNMENLFKVINKDEAFIKLRDEADDYAERFALKLSDRL